MALEGGEGLVSRPGHSLPPGKTRYLLYRRLGGRQDQSGQVRKISPTLGFNPWTVQPVASCYTNYATLPTTCVDVFYIPHYTHLSGICFSLKYCCMQPKPEAMFLSQAPLYTPAPLLLLVLNMFMYQT